MALTKILVLFASFATFASPVARQTSAKTPYLIHSARHKMIAQTYPVFESLWPVSMTPSVPGNNAGCEWYLNARPAFRHIYPDDVNRHGYNSDRYNNYIVHPVAVYHWHIDYFVF